MVVRIETPQGSRDGFGTKIFTAQGQPLVGVVAADVRIRMNEPIKAVLELWSGFTGKAEGEFVVRDPHSGELKPVKRIEFADGSTFGDGSQL
jgi:hypothetical protein